MIGNNSCGPHSVMAGKTVDNIETLDIVTYDGLRLTVGPTDEDELVRSKAIESLGALGVHGLRAAGRHGREDPPSRPARALHDWRRRLRHVAGRARDGRCRRPGCKKHAQWDPRKGMFYPHCQVDFKAANEAKRRAQEAERRDRPAQVWVVTEEGVYEKTSTQKVRVDVPEPENTTPPASKQQPKVTAAPAIPATGGSRVKVSEVLAALKAQEDAPDVTYTPRRRPGRKGHNPREAVEG